MVAETPEQARYGASLVQVAYEAEAPLTDLKTVELELAGIFPDLVNAVQGNSMAPETLRGAHLATERGWVAPAMPDTPPALPDPPEKK